MTTRRVDMDGYSFDLPEAFSELPRVEALPDLRRFADPAAGTVVATYRRRAVLTGEWRVDSVLGGVLASLCDAAPHEMSSIDRSEELGDGLRVAELRDDDGVRRTVAVLDDGEVAVPVIEVTRPPGDTDDQDVFEVISASLRIER